MSLKGTTIFITGASRGIGLAIARRCAQDGANVAIAAKTAQPDPRLPGTIYTAAKEIEEQGGKALPIICDIRSEDQVVDAIKQTVEKFGGIDILVNNASAISLTDTQSTTVKKYDLMHSVNGRGSWLVAKHAIPHLMKSKRNPHMLMISPPLSAIREEWFRDHVAYSISKFNMSMVALGLSGELRPHGIAVNTLWPASVVETAAVKNLLGGEAVANVGRKPDMMAEAAYRVFTKKATCFSGHNLIDDLFLRSEGVTDMDQYSVIPGNSDLGADFFVNPEHFDAIEQWRVAAKELGQKGNEGKFTSK
ncbi:hypothetical protein INT43_007651, partial [Umbelopsis isabellina]